MKKVLFLLAILFAFTFTASASATVETTDKPTKGYDYKKNHRTTWVYNFFHRPKSQNGGCGWHKAKN